MLEKLKRKKIDKQDGNMPTNIEQFIQKYDLEKLWPYIEKIIDYINNAEVAVSSIKPKTNQNIWIKYSNNLFNKKNAVAQWIASNGDTGTSTVTMRTGKIKIKANTDYVFSYDYETLASETDRQYCLYDNNLNVLNNSSPYYGITSKQFIINSSVDGYVDISYDINCTNIMLKEGVIPIEYEEYVESSINLRNEDEKYEEILNITRANNQQNYILSERVIGTWKNGKTLYEAVIEMTTPTVATDGTAVWKQAIIKNVEWGRVVSCDAKLNDTSNYSIINFMYPDNPALYMRSYFTVNSQYNNGVLEIMSNKVSYSDRPVVAIVQYTKVTD